MIVHRADLQHLLLEAAEGVPMRLNSPVRQVTSNEDGAVVELTSGEQLRADAVLGCDGVHSVTREVLGNPAPRYRGLTTWRAIVNGRTPQVTNAWLTVGAGKQFLASPLRADDTYWGAMVPMAEGANQALADKKAYLLGAFNGWHDPIGELIEATTEEQLVPADVFDAIPKTLTAGRIALLGDAAHPMTPDLGQGACMGIEDGVVAGACLIRHVDPNEALAEYQAARLRRVQSMVRDSRRFGAIFATTSRLGGPMRDAALGQMPSWINSRLLARYASEAAFEQTLPQ